MKVFLKSAINVEIVSWKHQSEDQELLSRPIAGLQYLFWANRINLQVLTEALQVVVHETTSEIYMRTSQLILQETSDKLNNDV